MAWRLSKFSFRALKRRLAVPRSDQRSRRQYDGAKALRDEAYKILGIKKGCSKEEIIKAANSLQKKIHPDVNPNSNTERLSQIVNEAKETVLKDFI